MREHRRVFPNPTRMTDDLIRKHLPLCQAVQKIMLMRSFDVFATIFVPMWMGLIGDPECEWEGLFWHFFTNGMDRITRTIYRIREEQQHLKTLFGDNWLDDDQPDIPNDDPRWQQNDAHMTQFMAEYDAKWQSTRKARREARVST